MQISINILKNIFKRNNIDYEFLRLFSFMLEHFAPIFNIKTLDDYARFLGNVYFEVGFYKNGKLRIRENLNYSAKRLAIVSRRFRHNKDLLNKAMSLKGIEKQKFIANNWYGYGRKAKILGNINPNDGFKYRGQGLLQITGRYNHIKVFKNIEEKLNIKVFDDNGDVLDSLLNSYFGAIISAFSFWDIKKIYNCKDDLCSINRINSGLPKIFKEQRLKYIKYVRKLLKGKQNGFTRV